MEVLVGVLVGAHGGGGIRESWGEKLVAVFGRKVAEKAPKNRAEARTVQGRKTMRANRGEEFGCNFEGLSDLIGTNMGWVS